jgi:glucosamine-phosphate N-acetyltransferase
MYKNLLFRNIIKDDYNQYIDLMYQFTNYKYNLSKDDFDKYIDDINNNNKQTIIVIIYQNELIGAGTLFKLIKLHNNPVGQIEDVIIKDKYRKNGYGKLIINKLTEIGINNYGCYKIILNCINKNINFYKKCGFEEVGVEMKYSI